MYISTKLTFLADRIPWKYERDSLENVLRHCPSCFTRPLGTSIDTGKSFKILSFPRKCFSDVDYNKCSIITKLPTADN